MMGINKLKVKKTATALLLAGCLFNLTGCYGNVDMDTVTLESLMEDDDIKDSTLIDELIAAGELDFEPYDEKHDFHENLIEASDRLERYMDIVDVTSYLDYKDVDKLDPLLEKDLEGLKDISLEEVNNLVEIATSDKKDLVSMENKLKAIKKLNYINTFCNEWIIANGKRISEKMMKVSVKASIANELDYTTDDYKYIGIRPRIEKEPGDYIIDIKDDKALKVPQSSEEIWNTINYVYAVENADFDDSLRERERATYRKSLNFAKTTLAAGAEIKKDKVKPENDASDIKKSYIKK